ncbi:MAG: hypothetical protein M3502_06445 [Actinomycetota bacterium]|nr:hypothetical protein [Actinomycetota bacterium]
MPITSYGPLCARRGCRGPVWRDRLCGNCWRLARLFGKDPRLFAYQPLQGYSNDRDAVELPWEQWEQAANAGGRGIADLFRSTPDRSEGPSDLP